MFTFGTCGRPKSSFKQRLLHEAIKSEDYLKVEELLTSATVTPGLDVSKDQCALELAVSTGNANIVQLLVQSGCCCASAGNGGSGAGTSEIGHEVQFRALDVAIYRRYNDIVDILLGAGFDISIRNGFSESRLHVAACGNNDVILRRLLDSGYDADETTCSWTACHVLAARNHVKTLKVLLRYGCDVEIRNKDGATPLMLALERNRLDPCFLLLSAGADARDVARQLKLTHDAVADEDIERVIIRTRQSSLNSPDVPTSQFAPSMTKFCASVRRRVYESPTTLKELAKFAIRKRLRGDVERKVTSLPLPPALTTFIVDIVGADEVEETSEATAEVLDEALESMEADEEEAP